MAETTADQAAGLRRMSAPRPVRVIAVASGKGGVGKTNVTVNLATAFSRLGRKTMILDADLGLANVDLMLGLQPQYNLSHVISGERTLEEVIVEGPGGVQIVPAASGIQAMAELSSAEHAGLIRAFSELNTDLDVLLVDSAAGISDNVISFSKAAQEVLVVVCDEPASITDAYALIKVLSRDHGIRRFHVVANMARDERQGRELVAKLLRATDQFLEDVILDYMGYVPFDEYLRKAVQKQKVVLEAYPSSKAAKAFKDLAAKADKWPMPRVAGGYLEFFVERLVEARVGEQEAWI